MGLASIVASVMVGESSLKELISKKYVSVRTKYPLLQGGFLRSSEFGNICPREEVLVSRDKLVRTSNDGADTQLTFLHGTALHWAIQNQLLPAIGIFVGRWTCLDCGKASGNGGNIPQSLVARPEVCSCGCREFLYRELELSNSQYRISGHPDGFMSFPGLPGIGVVEIKSIGQGWEIQQCPIFAHVIQLQIYMWLANLRWGKVLYWEKKGQGLDALVEHHVDRDDDAIAGIKRVITSIWKALEEDGPLPERLCATAKAPRAQKCCVSGPCFGTIVPSSSHPF